MTPPKESTAEDRAELRREKLRNKAARRAQLHRQLNSLIGRGLQLHQSKREIARRQRQAARDDQRQRERASMVTAIPAGRTPSRVSRRWKFMA